MQTFRAKAVELGLPPLATAALIGWEWLQRVEDIFATFDVSHYRPKERPHMVRVIDEKTNTKAGFRCSTMMEQRSMPVKQPKRAERVRWQSLTSLGI
jgi:hypothetical protein